MSLSEPVTIAERYANAAVTGNLKMREGHCDADLLIAAGYAAAKGPRKMMALRLYRAQVTRDRSDLPALEIEAIRLLQEHLSRSQRMPPMTQRHALVRTVFRWWLDQTCTYCNGLGYEVIANSPGLSAAECPGCRGLGKAPLKRALPGPLVRHGLWLAHEFDVLCAGVIGDMADVLRRDFDFVGATGVHSASSEQRVGVPPTTTSGP